MLNNASPHPVATQHRWLNKQTLSYLTCSLWLEQIFKKKRKKKNKQTLAMGLYWLKAGPCVSVLDCTYCQGLKHKSSMIKQLAWIALIIYQCKPPSEPRCHPSISWVEIFISWWLMEDAGFLWPGQLRMRHGQIWGWLQTWDIYNAICVCVPHRERRTQKRAISVRQILTTV